MHRLRIVSIGGFFLSAVCSWAQVLHRDSSEFPPVYIETVDVSATPHRYDAKAGSDVLQSIGDNTSIYINNYGPGQLSTFVARGSSAGQNAVYWNGVDIGSPMLGLLDLSQLNGGTFNRLEVAENGNAPQQTYIGGRISFSTHLDTTIGLTYEANFHQSSIGYRDIGIGLSSGNKRYQSSTRLDWLFGPNNFDFKTKGREERRMTHSKINQWSAAHSSQWLMTPESTLEAHIWWRGQDLDIGPSIHQVISRASQSDHNYRGVVHWTSRWNQLHYKLSASILHDRTRYIDPTISLNSPSNVTSYYIKSQLSGDRSNVDWFVGQEWTHSRAITTNYAITPSRNLHNIFGSLTKEWNIRHLTTGLLNVQWVADIGLYPSFRFNYRILLSDQWSWSAQIARAIRIPTLNDLFWAEGGNPDLKPEHAWKSEMDIRLIKNFGEDTFDARLTSFYTQTSDWILWQPISATVWSPINVRKVRSIGVEPNITYKRVICRANTLTSQLSYQWLKATYQNKLSPNDKSNGKQLIYAPVHSIQMALSYQHSRWSIGTQLTYKGKTYTSTDNYQSLPNYLLWHAHVDYLILSKGLRIDARIGGRNLTRQSYQVIESRAMPLDNYYMKFIFKFIK